MIEYHTLGGLNSINSLCHSSGSEKSEIRVLAGLIPSESTEGESIPCHSSSFRGLLAIFCIPWLVDASLDPCLYFHMAFPLCVCVFPNFPFYKDTSHVGLEPILMTSFHFSTLKALSPKQSHWDRFGGKTIQSMIIYN